MEFPGERSAPSNSTWTATAPTDTVQLRALDYAKALNEDPDSIFYQRLDMDNIGAMGHSQGAAATSNADNDPRIKAAIFWNTGNSDSKPYLNISGELTLGWWDWQLKGDEEAKEMFVGDDCGLCNTPDEFEYGHNSLLQ